MTISVTLDERDEAFIASQIASGRFKDKSEVICAGLRLLEADEARTEALRVEIRKGLEGSFIPAEEAFAHVREKIAEVARQKEANQMDNQD